MKVLPCIQRLGCLAALHNRGSGCTHRSIGGGAPGLRLPWAAAPPPASPAPAPTAPPSQPHPTLLLSTYRQKRLRNTTSSRRNQTRNIRRRRCRISGADVPARPPSWMGPHVPLAATFTSSEEGVCSTRKTYFIMFFDKIRYMVWHIIKNINETILYLIKMLSTCLFIWIYSLSHIHVHVHIGLGELNPWRTFLDSFLCVLALQVFPEWTGLWWSYKPKSKKYDKAYLALLLFHQTPAMFNWAQKICWTE